MTRPVTKDAVSPAMSSIDGSAGGSLRNPPAFGVPRRVVKRKFIKACKSDCSCKSCDPVSAFAARGEKSIALGHSYKYAGDAYGLDYVADEDAKVDTDAWSITIPFAASHGRDRQGDFLEVKGIDTTNHRKLPIAYLDHGKNAYWTLPIGRTEDDERNYTVVIDDERGLAWATIYLTKSLPVTEQLMALYADRVLRGGSIGYRPKKVAKLPADPRNGVLKDGVHLIETELLEVTLCGLPANGDCVAKALNTTWCGKSLCDPIKAMLTPHMPKTKVWTNGASFMGTKSNEPVAPAEAVQTKSDDVVSPEPEERIPHGAQTLADVYGALEAAVAVIEREADVLDNQDVKSLVKDISGDIAKCMKSVNAGFTKAYKDLEPLQAESTKDADEAPAEEVPETGEKKVKAIKSQDDAPASVEPGKSHKSVKRKAVKTTKDDDGDEGEEMDAETKAFVLKMADKIGKSLADASERLNKALGN